MRTKFMPDILCPDCVKSVTFVKKDNGHKLYICRCGWEWEDDAVDTGLEEIRNILDKAQFQV